jgi:LacI family transcriptional regulator
VLEQMLQGHPPPEPPVVVAPAGVTQRRSTDTLAIDHPAVAQAVRLIRDEACEGLTVAQLVRRVPLGRRALEQAFKRIVGRTLLQELRRVQVERARSLLRGTDLPTPDIAARCGFGHRSRFSHAFKAELGVSPMAFRRGADPEAD